MKKKVLSILKILKNQKNRAILISFPGSGMNKHINIWFESNNLLRYIIRDILLQEE